MKDRCGGSGFPSGSWSKGRTENLRSCPVCHSRKRPKESFTRGDDLAVTPDTWTMLRCADCNSLYLNPRPDAQSLVHAYSDYYTHYAQQNEHFSKGMLTSLVNGYLNIRFSTTYRNANIAGFIIFSALEPLRLKLEHYGRHLPKQTVRQKNTLFDIGCGNGAFLSRANAMGWIASGCDTDEEAILSCKSQNLDAIHGGPLDSKFDDRHFDVITMSHVLEHVTSPKELIQRAYELLNPGGLLWIATPNPDAIGLKTFGASWRSLHMPLHLIIPSQKELERTLREAGFSQLAYKRRGLQSTSLWRESEIISSRELHSKSTLMSRISFIISNLVSTISHRWSEETIITATK